MALNNSSTIHNHLLQAAAAAAYDFVRGIWPPPLIDALFNFALVGVDALDWFGRLVPSFARAARSHLWRPVWGAWYTRMASLLSSPPAE